MPITQQELGRRLKAAREALGLTQDNVAASLDLSRSAVAQMELGNRAVSSLELDRLAHLYGRDIRELLSDQFREEDALIALFRADGDLASHAETAATLRHCMNLGRELANLEWLVGLDHDTAAAVRYSLPSPRSKSEAIRQGADVADQERRRLGIGDAPVSNIIELLETQGVRTALVDLPEDVSGLTLFDREVGPFVVVNEREHLLRRTFSFAHEYGHVLLDRDAQRMISRDSHRDDLPEVRANSFAANLLMPATGVRQFLATLGKGSDSRLFAEAPTKMGAISIEARSRVAAPDIQLLDVVLLAHQFGVSRSFTLYRLHNLKIIGERDFQTVWAQNEAGKGSELARLLDLPEPDHQAARHFFRHRFLRLALEAYGREAITRSKFAELAATVLDAADAERLLDVFTADEPHGPADCLLPAG
ncbi:MAG: XRE family transcriptional regulator [Methylacidiphilaceae bacterium]|nr:XRE family transcriptional regulator [Candidatus Methylacidiphilaceae bacterium]